MAKTDSDSDIPTWGNITLGVIIGLLIGGGIALLFAPKRGEHLRSDIGGTVDDLKGRANQLIDGLQDTTAELIARSKQVMDDTRDNITKSVEAGKEAYVQKKDELTTQLDG